MYVGNNRNYININDVVKHHKEYPKKEVKEANALQEKYSGILQVSPKKIENFLLYQFIDEWYGVAYHLGGTDKTGIDCSAFAQTLYRQVFGIDLMRTAMEQFTTCSLKKGMRNLKEGDLVFFRIHSRHITHVGVYLTNDYFVHASTSKGVAIDNLNEKYWHQYYAGAGTILKTD